MYRKILNVRVLTLYEVLLICDEDERITNVNHVQSSCHCMSFVVKYRKDLARYE